jgi:hypothetical protein
MVSISRASGGRPIRVLGTVAPSTTGKHRSRFKQNLMPRRAIPCFGTHCLPHRAQSSLPDAKTVNFDFCPMRQGCGEVFGRPLRCGMVLPHGAFPRRRWEGGLLSAFPPRLPGAGGRGTAPALALPDMKPDLRLVAAIYHPQDDSRLL